MIATQYKITLPSDYDMNIIRDRVTNNGHKTACFIGGRLGIGVVASRILDLDCSNAIFLQTGHSIFPSIISLATRKVIA